MFTETISKNGSSFTTEAVDKFINNYVPWSGNKDDIIVEYGVDFAMLTDRNTNESIRFEKNQIIVNKRCPIATEQYENAIISDYLSSVYSDAVYGVPESPICDIYDEYMWYSSVEPGVYECIGKKDVE